ncbi:hypothetical protein [Vibrio ezurae]|uniref:Outer membrane protein beta-barrel domain-containing protein n=1 Tax=Vibrio ezurae NBRC 102218 TaxID=1219080 RepID=U3B446_9VIBR|nr:hypothetical protein [Vibrio ezurae]GAD80705.1 hypothetical protein VEZ01S_39_00020 [Vibrio ezurae NBRC 102218]
MRAYFRHQIRLIVFALSLFFTAQAYSAPDYENAVAADSGAYSLNNDTPHRFFMSAISGSGEQFDEWKVDTGYAYSVFENVDLYVATRISSSTDTHSSRGFLSGVNYHYSNKLSLNSAIYASPDVDAISIRDYMGAELSGKYMLTESLNLKATLDYEEWQSAIEVKLGFSF